MRQSVRDGNEAEVLESKTPCQANDHSGVNPAIGDLPALGELSVRS